MKLPLVLLTLGVLALGVSAYQPADAFTWILEVFPAILGSAAMIATYRKFPLTNLLYSLIFVHALILMVGGHYTYAEVPLGYWMEDWFGFTRNHYDRIGHFAQGFVPAVAAREILLRRSPLQPGKMLYEMEGVDEASAREAFRLAAAKLPLKTTFVIRLVG